MKKGIIISLILLIGFVVFAQDVPADPEPSFNWWTIVSGVLAVLATIFGAAFRKVKAKIKLVYAFLKEGLDVVFVLTEALDDNNVDAEEVKQLKAAVAEAKGAWKAIWAKLE